MTIQYLGLSCLKFTIKNPQDVILITDPFDPKVTGLKIPHQKADLVISSQKKSPLSHHLNLISGVNNNKAQIIDSPGEYEIASVYMEALSIEGADNPANIFYIELEKITFAFLGGEGLVKGLTSTHLDVLEGVDVLVMPVGGNLDIRSAKEIISQIEPRIIIPTYFKVTGLKNPNLNDIDMFLKEAGNKNVDHVNTKLKLTKKDLPSQNRQTYIIKP